MSVHATTAKLASISLFSSFILLACGSSSSGPSTTDTGGSDTGGTATTGGSNGQGGSSIAGSVGNGGSNPTGGMTGGGSGGASGGGGPGGSGGAGGSGGGVTAGTGGTDPNGDPPAPHPLSVTAAPALYKYTKIDAKGNEAGVDTRAAKMAGKLVIDLGVTQGHFNANLAKRGFHSMSALQVNACSGINGALFAGGKGPAYDGDCRLNTLDGKPHGAESTVSVADSIMTQIATNLKALKTAHADQGWGYFLNDDDSVRWSDVAWTGYSHGATSAVVFAFTLRSYRAVAMSGPRDNVCGTGVSKTPDFDPAKPPYDTACPASKIANWEGLTPVTPIERFFSFTGLQDSEYGDIMFAAEHLHFVGVPTNITTGKAPYGGTHRFYAATGHSDFSSGYDDAVNIAFGVLPENLNPTF